MRALKKAVLGTSTVQLVDKIYRVAYEARCCSEESDYRILARLAHGRTCVFDIGANIGASALVMASNLSSGGVLYTFEPAESACLTIRENAMLNGLEERLRIINALVGATSGSIAEFHWDMVSERLSTLMETPSGMSLPLLKTTLAIDDFVRQLGLVPEFVKIDVEGAESQVLRGMKGVLTNSKPLVFVELHVWPGVSAEDNAALLFSTLADTN